MKSFKSYFAFLLIVLTCIAFFIAVWVYFNLNQIGDFFFQQQNDYITAMNQQAESIVKELNTDSLDLGKEIQAENYSLVTEPFYIVNGIVAVEKENRYYNYLGKHEEKIFFLAEIKKLMQRSIDTNHFDLIKLIFLLIIAILFLIAFFIYRSFMKDIQKDLNLVISEIKEENVLQDIQISEFALIVQGLKKYREISKQINKQSAVMDLMEQWNFESRKIIHDLKNPLQRLSLTINEIPDNEKQTNAIQALDEMNNYVNRLKISSVDEKQNSVEINLNDFFKKNVVLFEEINISYKSELASFKFDEFSLQRLVSNLIQNAIDAGASNIEFSFFSDTETEVLEIKNDGEMIIEKEKLFSPYSTSKTKGTGLGLLIISQIVHKEKGKFYLLKSDKKETIFRMERTYF
jgi:signal transduction histidine kinase